MTYKQIQQRAAQFLGVRPSSVKTCWIAEVKRESGETRGTAPNSGIGKGAPPCPPSYRTAIERALA